MHLVPPGLPIGRKPTGAAFFDGFARTLPALCWSPRPRNCPSPVEDAPHRVLAGGSGRGPGQRLCFTTNVGDCDGRGRKPAAFKIVDARLAALCRVRRGLTARRRGRSIISLPDLAQMQTAPGCGAAAFSFAFGSIKRLRKSSGRKSLAALACRAARRCRLMALAATSSRFIPKCENPARLRPSPLRFCCR